MVKNTEFIDELKELKKLITKQDEEISELKLILKLILEEKLNNPKSVGYFNQSGQNLVNKIVSPAMQDTLKAIEELMKNGKDADAETISKVTQRSKQRESQYLSLLYKLGLIDRVRKGKNVFYSIIK